MTTKLPAPVRLRLHQLADCWVEQMIRDLANGAEIGDWKDDAQVPYEHADAAYGFLMDRFADWSALIGAVIRTRRVT